MNVNSDQFHVSGGWGPRTETLEACASRIQLFLDLIEPLDPALTTWYEQASSRRAGLNRPIGRDIGAIRRLVRKGLISPEEPNSGTQIGAWNGDALRLVVRCGENDAILSNAVHLELPSIAFDGLDELDPELAERALTAAVDAFEPDWAVVSSDSLRRELIVDNQDRYGGFITFVSEVDRAFQLPPGVTLQTLRQGFVLRLADRSFIPSDPSQRRAIGEVTQLLSHLQGDDRQSHRHC